MRFMQAGYLSIVLLTALVLAPASAQDNELQKVLIDGLRPGEAKLNLACLRAESDGLEKIISRLSDYRSKQLHNLEDKTREIRQLEEGDDLETTQALLRNARMELQKLTWDEAAEAAMLEEIAQGETKRTPSRQSLMEADMRSRIEVAQRNLASQQQRLNEMSSRSHSRSEIGEQTLKIDSLQAEIEALVKQVNKIAEINKADAELPVLESKRRLAQLRVRRRLLEEEISSLAKTIPKLRELAASQWLLDLDRKAIDSVQAHITPLQLRKLEVEALVTALESKMEGEK